MKPKKQMGFFRRLADLYGAMDAAWSKVADQYGFQCTGCSDNCCESEFYHHSFIEKDFLISGLLKMNPDQRKQIRQLAQKVNEKRQQALDSNTPLRIMCPVNIDGLCSLYPYRPMICRLHGIPHELSRPGILPVKSPGCEDGFPLFDNAGYIQFDRTPFYKSMAALEMEYRKVMKKRGKIKQNIAQMLSIKPTRR